MNQLGSGPTKQGVATNTGSTGTTKNNSNLSGKGWVL
ncbi:hypothetical protein DDB_G0295823 [Dictyostelium discoideum AX4]|uniref:Putative uncharacterized protein DDB_G0295823 n=1 Tax=Dictyostelium discoideum TaxID=44689 RepID=Y6642_DICDI|nr:hypothetical protein DDB_G0295823 [Dictyostelium discoideum AX4]P0C7T1.1 RecName: Full=Putative uncharacterized protein DDB_G0295823 [Dictyostelium discoideum]EEU04082.1 hypothetical protein DDB_G0295823 [Dictyostelium discoideum AX4]|eukprot:XP_002649134.1 hypothetical protein DDB_G0295823 [Dictyostelium discoideum AX4]